jgi:hypothetical protein
MILGFMLAGLLIFSAVVAFYLTAFIFFAAAVLLATLAVAFEPPTKPVDPFAGMEAVDCHKVAPPPGSKKLNGC